jgi:hypothetical protein
MNITHSFLLARLGYGDVLLTSPHGHGAVNGGPQIHPDLTYLLLAPT